MNFYKHHLGDYDGATMHLTWDEDMAYTRLLRVYYRDEKPIPLEPRQAYRLTRAQSKGQRKAVDEVLKEYFEKQVDGWHNKRADEEIAAAKAQQETNRRIAANRPRSVNGSHHESSHGSSTIGLPIQTPDSTSQTPPSNSEHTPTLASEGARVGNDSSGGNPRQNGTNPRALGTNPRAIGTNPRATKDRKPAEKWTPSKTWQELEAEEQQRERERLAHANQ